MFGHASIHDTIDASDVSLGVGALALIAGIFLEFGLGFALIAFGLCCILLGALSLKGVR